MREDLEIYVDRELEKQRLEEEKRTKEYEFSSAFMDKKWAIHQSDLELMTDIGLISKKQANEYSNAYDRLYESFCAKRGNIRKVKFESIFAIAFGGGIGALLGAIGTGVIIQPETNAAFLSVAPYSMGIPAVLLATLGEFIVRSENKEHNKKQAAANLALDHKQERFENYKAVLQRTQFTDLKGIRISQDRLNELKKKYGNIATRLDRIRRHFKYYTNLIEEHKNDKI